LEIAKDGSRKTRIMYLGNLSYELVQKYLDLLLRFDLVELRDSPEKSFVATEKGQRFLEDYYELRKYSEMAEAKKRALEANLPARV
jgi:predicted transcriptional regulator